MAGALAVMTGCVDQSKNPKEDAASDVFTGWPHCSGGDPVGADAGAGTDGAVRGITSAELVDDMGLGWNLGNSLDAVGGETAWGNPAITQALILAVKAAGFKSIRIPITWRQHYGAGPTYTVDSTWMARVQQVVDWTVDAGLYAIINMHHDGGGDTTAAVDPAWLRAASTSYDVVIEKYRTLWAQIAERFEGYSDYVVFESMNEVGFDDLKANGSTSQAAFDLLNRMNDEFVKVIRASGGYNGRRHLLLAGYFTDIDETVKGVIMPDDCRVMLSVHYYTPYQFCINGNPTTWGSEAELAVVQRQLDKVKTAFIDRGVPVIMGEYGASARTEAASRVFWMEHVAKACRDRGIAPFLWDNGAELDRKTLNWRTPGLLDAMHRVSSGTSYTITKG